MPSATAQDSGSGLVAELPILSTGPGKWWKDAIVYQVWPASFQDSNGDGIGDIPGIISRLDHIKSLGANTLWLSPMYASPQIDMGYDISDYKAIYPPYGTMEDMDNLIKGCHDRGIKILCDLVINHTSDEHEWFKESRSSKDNPKRDWYIWRPAKYDAEGNRHPPNNWRSCFSESAWEWDEHTQEYYLHLFVKGQPDLNWTNAECKAAMFEDAVEFWLRKGVDGFRIDTASLYSKPMDFPDAPVVDPKAPFQPAFDLFCDGPDLMQYLRELGAVFAKYDAMTVGEFPNATIERCRSVVSASDPMMSMIFHFNICDHGRNVAVDAFQPLPTTLSQLKALIEMLQTHTEGTDSWLCHFLENHDIARSISRYGNDSPEHRAASGRLLALLNATQSGTLFLYQGQEIGQVNFSPDWSIDEYKDVQSINYMKLQRDMGATEDELKVARDGVYRFARDHARTPVQWSAEEHAGFTEPGGARPWMRVADHYKEINTAAQEDDPMSVLNFYRRALALRKTHLGALGHGTFRLHDASNDDSMVYTKTAPSADGKVANGETLLVALNFATEAKDFTLPASVQGKPLVLLLSTHAGKPEAETTLRPLEGRLYLVSSE